MALWMASLFYTEQLILQNLSWNLVVALSGMSTFGAIFPFCPILLIILKLGCLKVAAEAQFSCPGFGPPLHLAAQYLGTLIGCSAEVLYSCGVQNSRHC